MVGEELVAGWGGEGCHLSLGPPGLAHGHWDKDLGDGGL